MTVTELPRSTPEAQGIPSTAIAELIDAIAQDGLELHSLMLLRHGQVVAEGWWSPYRATQPHLLYSLSKSFTSTAVGLAAAEGRLSVDDRVLDFFPEEAPTEVSLHLDAMRVHHLLCMSTGHEEDTFGRMIRTSTENWVQGILALPPEHAPGSIFCYNNGATYLQAAIVEKVTGTGMLDYLRPRLLDPLGITDATWDQSPQGIVYGFSGLYITTEAIARFGQLYLQRGQWQGQQLIPAAWVARATSRHVDNALPDKEPDWCQGYGYQFWRCQHGVYRGDGAFGQFCIVMDEHDAVLATTSGASSMQGILDRIWEILLPAFAPAALPENPSAHVDLTEKLAHLALPLPQGEATSARAATISRQPYHFTVDPDVVRDFEEPRIEAIVFACDGSECCVAIHDADGRIHHLVGGYGAWRMGVTTFWDQKEVPVAVAYAWPTVDSLEMKVCYVRTPHCATLTFDFTDDPDAGSQVRYSHRWNVSFGPTELPELVGRQEEGRRW